LMMKDHLGGGAPRVCGNSQKLRIDALPLHRVAIHRNYGIQIKGLQYRHPILHEWMGKPRPDGEKHMVRKHPFFAGEALWLHPVEKVYYPIPLGSVPPRDFAEFELSEAKKYCDQLGWARNHDNLLRAIQELDEIEKTAERKTLSARRLKERRKQADLARQRERTRPDCIFGPSPEALSDSVVEASQSRPETSSKLDYTDAGPIALESIGVGNAPEAALLTGAETTADDPPRTRPKRERSAPPIDLSKMLRF
jgi:hypothetical protein